MGMNSVAGILDKYGGLRVVVAHKDSFHCHLQPEEILFVVPKFKVYCPVEWNKIPYVVRRVEKHIEWWIRTRNDPDALRPRAIVEYRRRCAAPRTGSLHVPSEMR